MHRSSAACAALAFIASLSSSLPAAAQNAATASPAAAVSAPTPQDPTDHDHMMEVAGGPVLKFRGFADINLGVGSAANPLVFPLGVPAHTSFQLGEFDLFMTS